MVSDPKTPEDIQSEIIEKILEADYTIATDVGQPLRRIIIDPVADVISRAYNQDYKTRLSQNIDNLSGSALDDFLANFGFKRRAATRAYGTLTLSRSTPADTLYLIPYGARFCTIDGIFFRTTAQAYITYGERSVDVPAEAEIAGESGNVSANSICIIVNAIAGITSVTNLEAFSGGADAESDEELRERFKREVLKNIYGTKDHYIGMATDFPECSFAGIISPSEFVQELVEFETINISPPATGAILSFSSNYIYENSVFVETQDRTYFYTKNSDWTIEEGIPETNNKYWIKVVESSNLHQAITAGESYVWVSYDYKPIFSRGPGCVELMVCGEKISEVSDVFKYQEGTTKYYFTKRPVREIIIVKNLTQGNIVSNPSNNPNYRLVLDTSNANKSTSAADYIEILNTSEFDDGDFFQVDYSYNSLIEDIQKEIRERKQVTADVLAHEGIPVYLDIEAKIMLGGYNQYVPKDKVDIEIKERLEEYISSLGFGAIIQFSDLEFYAHQVTGVDNIKILSIKATPQEGFEGITEIGGIYNNDFVLDLNQYPVLNSLTTDLRSYATWED